MHGFAEQQTREQRDAHSRDADQHRLFATSQAHHRVEHSTHAAPANFAVNKESVRRNAVAPFGIKRLGIAHFIA